MFSFVFRNTKSNRMSFSFFLSFFSSIEIQSELARRFFLSCLSFQSTVKKLSHFSFFQQNFFERLKKNLIRRMKTPFGFELIIAFFCDLRETKSSRMKIKSHFSYRKSLFLYWWENKNQKNLSTKFDDFSRRLSSNRSHWSNRFHLFQDDFRF